MASVVSAACIAAVTTHLVSVKVVEGHVSTSRKWTTVAMMWNRRSYQRCLGSLAKRQSDIEGGLEHQQSHGHENSRREAQVI
jgi:hypothetical protein